MKNAQEESKKKTKGKKLFAVFFSIVLLLVILRLILPFIVLKYVNNALADLQEYYGHVEDIDIALIRGAYKINDLRIDKIDKRTHEKDSIPFFTTPEIDLSVEWSALFKGAFRGEYVENPVLNFVKGKHKGEDIRADTADFRGLIKKLMPLTVNHFQINNGQIHYIDMGSKPRVDISMKNIQVKADNLSNVEDKSTLLPATLIGTGDAYDGKFELNVRFNVNQKKPTFDFDARMTDMNLVLLNDFLKAYGNFDLKKGMYGLYAEFAAKDGSFNGYVKPIIKDLDVVQFNKAEGPPMQIIWESVVGSSAEILQNQKKEQLATKLPIEGRFDDPEASLWTAINYLLRNAFVTALQPSIDHTINITKVGVGKEKKTFIQKIFSKKVKNSDPQ